jgi:glutathione synthase/RimK-type ligase-like ATP-grasp enzyme
MRKYASTSTVSKWTKTEWLLSDPWVKTFVPETMLFDKNALELMLKAHPVIYFKPTNGTGGNKIIRIEQPSSDTYLIQYDTEKTELSSFTELYNKLQSFSNGRSYLLQQGISLAQTDGNPFDLRVMVQKSNSNVWIPTAIVTKIGKPDKIVTNYHQGGKLSYLRETLEGANYSDEQIMDTEKGLEQLGVEVGKCFDNNKEGMRELGLDVAIDQDGHFWILEVNTRPCIYPLKNMNDKKMYKRVVRLAKQYGRM